ncbi:MAG: ribosome silencing factor [Saccharofermentanales bacterium]|nr:ribosome silencing factor [Clostridiaceae bacterium]
MTAEETATNIRKILEDKKGLDIEVINVEGKTILTDRFVLATGNSVTHVKSLSSEVEKNMKDNYHRVPDHIEGYDTGRWILMDYGDVVVHLFHGEERSFYSLEKLWQAVHRG